MLKNTGKHSSSANSVQNLLLCYLNVFISLTQTQLFWMYQWSCQWIYTLLFIYI